MTAQNKTTIKSYFETGDRPTQGQFSDLVDSYIDSIGLLGNVVSATEAGQTGLLNVINASAATFLQVGAVGKTLVSAATTAQAVSRLGGGTAGIQVFQSTTTAQATSSLGLGTAAFINTGVSAGQVPLLIDVGTSAALPAVRGDQLKGVSLGFPVTSYTPTFTGLGATVSGVSFLYGRNGSFLEIRGFFIAGTVTGTEARISLPTGFTAASTLPTIGVYGVAVVNINLTGAIYVLGEPSVPYATLGISSGTTNGIVKSLGTGFSNGMNFSVSLSIPIQGW